MYRVGLDPPPEAGPSSRPYVPAARECEDYCGLGSEEWPLGRGMKRIYRAPQDGGRKRQEPTTQSTTGSSTTSSSSYSNTLFVGPSTTSTSLNSNSSSSTSSVYYPTASTSNSESSTTSTTTFSRTPSSLYTTSARYTNPAQASQSAYVPGVLINLTLGGDSDFEAVYGAPVSFGHVYQSASSSRKGKRRASADWDGLGQQNMTLQIDLGSSDMWVAADMCKTQDCNGAPKLFNASLSIDSGEQGNVSYYSGAASGEIFWEQVTLGGFSIGYQAFIAASSVSNEDLSGGQFSGVLGLALPASSTILSEIPGTTSSNPDGATFLDNLFGSGASAPSQRLFSLALARREDVRTQSVLGIGTISSTLCKSPCNPPYMPIVAQPSLGVTGYLHWRVQLQGISVTKWGNAQAGTGNTTTLVSLGASQVLPSKNSPLVVMDSGGLPIMVGAKSYADALYGPYSITASSDGLYRMPCSTQLAFTFHFANQDVPIHPLDMSWPDPADPSQATCIGAVQYTSGLGETGDFILGSAFLKNVYSIFTYPDYNRTVTWQPTVGLIPLTNASIASQDFYAVRVQRQSLSSVSANGVGSTNSGDGSTTSGQVNNSSGPSKAVVSTAVIVGSCIGGFFVISIAAFCAWWFWLRRKYGAAGVVHYRDKKQPRGDRAGSDLSSSSVRLRKHEDVQRQKSMVEGYSDYEGDSWTEGGDSIRLGYIPEVLENEDDQRTSRPVDRSSAASSVRTNSANILPPTPTTKPLLDFSDGETSPPIATVPLRRETSPAPSHTRNISFGTALEGRNESPNRQSQIGPYPYPGSVPPSTSSRSMSMSMAGPFPSPMRLSTARVEGSPLYDIRTSDYFTVVPSTNNSNRGRQSTRRATNDRSGSDSTSRPRDGLEGEPRRASAADALVESPADVENL